MHYVPHTYSLILSHSTGPYARVKARREVFQRVGVNEVHDELMDAIQKLEAPAKKLILTKLAAALQSLAAANAPQQIQRVAEPDPEEGRSIQRMN